MILELQHIAVTIASGCSQECWLRRKRIITNIIGFPHNAVTCKIGDDIRRFTYHDLRLRAITRVAAFVLVDRGHERELTSNQSHR